jgi:hypothetical protein
MPSEWMSTLYSYLTNRGGENDTYKIDCYLYTYKCVKERINGETRVHSLGLPRRAWRGDGHRRTTCT